MCAEQNRFKSNQINGNEENFILGKEKNMSKENYFFGVKEL